MNDSKVDRTLTKPPYREVFETFCAPESDSIALDNTYRVILETRYSENSENSKILESEAPPSPRLSTLPQLDLGQSENAHFKIENLLGEGGLGVVHLASQTALSREVALKSSKTLSNGGNGDAALLLEARAMGLVEHPNVVPVYLIGQNESGRPVIVMKRIHGEPWSDWIDHTPKVEDELEFHLRTFMGVCRAVAYSHSKGILHRDIKPQNIMLGAFGEVYLLDWGLAIRTTDDVKYLPARETVSGVAGTPAYLAPEMAAGKGVDLNPQTDIFLLGATLFHVLTKAPPNCGETLFDVLQFSYSGAKRTYPEDFPAELKSICERAMALNPEDRYSSAEELRLDIQAFLKNRSSYELSKKAKECFQELTEMEGDELHAKFAEVRFGYRSALQIHPENRAAREGLRTAISWMIERELSEGNVAVARSLLTQTQEPMPELSERIEALDAANTQKQQELTQIAFDYNENIGIRSRRLFIAIMAITFAICPFLLDRFKGRPVPESLSWITDDYFLLAVNGTGLLFAPILVGANIYTYRKLWAHKASRIIIKSISALFVVGIGMRLLSLTGEVPLKYVTAVECSVYATGLLVLGVAVDRRFGPPSWLYMVTALLLVFTSWPPSYLLCGGSVASCISFLLYRKNPSTDETSEEG